MYKEILKPRLFFSALLLLLMNVSPCWSATFYISPNGHDATGNGSSDSPWRTTAKAFSKGGGNTYIFKDGIYNYQGGDINNPPSGSPGNPTVIKSEHDGRAVIDGGGLRSGISISQRSYITIEGFLIQNAGENDVVSVGSPDGTAISNQTNNIIIRRTGVKGSAFDINAAAWSFGRVRDSLIEDSWAWGYGRYTLLLYGCTRVTARRVVLRWDGWRGQAYKPNDPKYDLGVYNTHDSLIENVLLLDKAARDGGENGGIYLPGGDNGNTAPYTNSSNNTIIGTISLNNDGYGLHVEGMNKSNRFINVVTWGNDLGVSVLKGSNGTIFDHVTIARNRKGSYFGDPVTLTNSLIYGNSALGVSGSPTRHNNNVFENNPDGASLGSQSISQDPQMQYITRIEDGSPGDGRGSDGGDMGATVVKRYIDGALTSENLWPWPYQDRIKAEMCGDVRRGFCSAASLTDYIWGYLGNSVPLEYRSGSGTPPPHSSQQLRVIRH
jgi:hypothetical protein